MGSGLTGRAFLGVVIFLAGSARAQPAPPDAMAARVDTLFAVAARGEWRYAEMREAAWDSLVALGAPAAARLAAYLDTERSRERVTLREIFVRIGSPTVPYLVAALTDTARRAPRLAARIIGRIGAPEALKQLLGLVDHEDWQMRAQVAYALGRIGDQRASPSLLALLADSVAVVRGEAAASFEHIRDSAAVGALVSALGDPYYAVRDGAQASLVAMSPDAVGALAAVVDDPSVSPLARRAAVGTLAQCDAELALEPLLMAATAEDWVVRLRTIEGLVRRPGDVEVRERLDTLAADRHPLVQRRARRVLAELGRRD